MDEPTPFTRRLMRVLWPAFLVAAIANAAFFTLLDPQELTLFGAPVELSRELAYTIGFFAFWAIATASSALTCYLSSGSEPSLSGCFTATIAALTPG